jgi:hypothetical protein
MGAKRLIMGLTATGPVVRSRRLSPREIAFKKAFDVAMDAAAALFFEGYALGDEREFDRTGVGIGPIAGDARGYEFCFAL